MDQGWEHFVKFFDAYQLATHVVSCFRLGKQDGTLR